MSRADRLVWIDLEMSGLDPERCTILEIATIVTDGNLKVIANGPNLAIHQPSDVLLSMDSWNCAQHAKTGLTERVKKSDLGLFGAESQTLKFLKEHIDAGVSPLCGNSVHHDRLFIKRYMPDLSKFLHYRHIDVSTVKELARRWYGDAAKYQKQGNHIALSDIKESIEELRFYRENFFKGVPV
ncbi:MAG: oligoribonuclease [Planctomycetota bacterium]